MILFDNKKTTAKQWCKKTIQLDLDKVTGYLDEHYEMEFDKMTKKEKAEVYAQMGILHRRIIKMLNIKEIKL